MTQDEIIRMTRLDAFEEAAKLVESEIAELEAEHEGWRRSFGENCAQPHESEIDLRRQLASAIRLLGSK